VQQITEATRQLGARTYDVLHSVALCRLGFEASKLARTNGCLRLRVTELPELPLLLHWYIGMLMARIINSVEASLLKHASARDLVRHRHVYKWG